MSRIEKVSVDLSVVLGNAQMPVHQLLRMGRGAVIELDGREDEPFLIYANEVPIAEGEIIVDGDRIQLRIDNMLKRRADHG